MVESAVTLRAALRGRGLDGHKERDRGHEHRAYAERDIEPAVARAIAVMMRRFRSLHSVELVNTIFVASSGVPTGERLTFANRTDLGNSSSVKRGKFRFANSV